MLTDAEVLEFYDRASGEVYRYASRLVGGNRSRADDLVQETFLTLVRQVRSGRDEPVDVGWAITTCRSRFLDQIRRSERAERTQPRAFERRDTGELGAPSPATEALFRLGDAQRAALVLRYIDDMTVAEVAAALGRSVHATESLLVRAREALRTEYTGMNGAE
ncbi:MAG: putative polymerase sigma factor, sigma-70 family [Ilumatobacteraceae bacterium]|nr:putative polymerase sigma factor, sigma-70 family [Ilumatobacteraceae bacterium]